LGPTQLDLVRAYSTRSVFELTRLKIDPSLLNMSRAWADLAQLGLEPTQHWFRPTRLDTGLDQFCLTWVWVNSAQPEFRLTRFNLDLDWLSST